MGIISRQGIALEVGAQSHRLKAAFGLAPDALYQLNTAQNKNEYVSVHIPTANINIC